MIKPGKKTKEWDRVRKHLKIQFEMAGITYCEKCGSCSFLSFAHANKRRNSQGDKLWVVVLLCVPCHEKIERLPESEMQSIVEAIITNRRPNFIPEVK